MADTDEGKPGTALFADLKGSAELATQHDPEQLRALLSAFFDEMRQQIEAFGDIVGRFPHAEHRVLRSSGSNRRTTHRT